MEKIRIRDGKKSDPGSGKTSRIRNTAKLMLKIGSANNLLYVVS
jgi:hypothetical protein